MLWFHDLMAYLGPWDLTWDLLNGQSKPHRNVLSEACLEIEQKTTDGLAIFATAESKCVVVAGAYVMRHQLWSVE